METNVNTSMKRNPSSMEEHVKFSKGENLNMDVVIHILIVRIYLHI